MPSNYTAFQKPATAPFRLRVYESTSRDNTIVKDDARSNFHMIVMCINLMERSPPQMNNTVKFHHQEKAYVERFIDNIRSDNSGCSRISIHSRSWIEEDQSGF